MHVEVSVALNFVISYLYNKLPRRRVDMFGEELERGLKRKFDGHWYGEQPFKGSAYRCIRVTAERVEPVIELAASLSRIDIEEVVDYLPRDLTIWIDPGEVSYRIGEKGVVKVLYSARQTNDGLHLVDREIAAASRGFNPDAQCFKPIDSLSSSLSNLSVSPGTTSPTNGPTSTVATTTGSGGLVSSAGGATSPWATGSVSPIGSGSHYGSSSPSSAGSVGSSSAMQNAGVSQQTQQQQAPLGPPQPIASFLNRNQNSTMTTAMFAQTKFGSTKLKTQAKRPSRLSPTELGAYIKQRSSPQASLLSSPSAGPPGGGMVGPFAGPGSGVGRQQHAPSSLSPRGGTGNRGGPMLPPYGVEGNRGLPPFYLLAQQGAPPPPPPPTTSGGHLQQGPPQSTPLPPPPATSLQDLYGPVLPSHFTHPPPAPHFPSLNMPPFHDLFPTNLSSSASSSVSSATSGVNAGAGMAANTPSPDGGLSHKTFLEGLNYGNLSNYPSLQHLLVAN